MYGEQERALLQGSECERLPDAKLVRKTPDTEMLTVLVMLHPLEASMASDRIACPSDERGASERGAERATRSQRPDRLETVIAKIYVFAKEYGLLVVETDKEIKAVKLTGTAAQMEQAFYVDLHEYSHPQGSYRGRTGGIYLPLSLLEIVSGVFGLEQLLPGKGED